MEEVFVIDAEEKDEVLKQLEDALKHIDDVKKGQNPKDHVDAEVLWVWIKNKWIWACTFWIVYKVIILWVLYYLWEVYFR